jgi:Uncharacterized conserved protein (DUF2190)
MAVPLLTLTYRCPSAAVVPARRFVRHGAADHEVQLAANDTVPILGVSEQVGGVAGQPVDVIHLGVAVVEAGGAVARSSLVTADATGRAVVSAPAAGVNAFVGGVALETATAAGDLIRVLIRNERIQG